MAPTSRSNVPIMRVYTQPQPPQPVTKFNVHTFPSNAFNPATSAQHFHKESTSSSTVEPEVTPAKTSSLKFYSHQFQDGKQITLRPPADPTPPPPKRRRKTAVPRENRKTYLSAHRPLQNAEQVHKDIWGIIFSFCHPKLLLEARYIDSLRYSILSSHQKIWRDSRLLHFGDSCPPCPASLTEQQYVDLLVGRGCQVRSCPHRNTYNVSWPFLGRLCMDCLLQKTIKSDDLPMERQHLVSTSENLWDALPMAHYTSRRHGNPRRVNRDGTDWLFLGGSYLFLRSDYDKLEKEYLRLKSLNTPETDITQWWQAKKDETIRHMVEIQTILSWRTKLRSDRWSDGRNPSVSRRLFFEDKAAALDPPMTKKELERMTAFHKALRSQNPPSELAWETLYEKIRPHRGTATRILEIRSEVRESYFDRGDTLPGLATDRKLKDHRRNAFGPIKIYKPEQEFVLNLGASEYSKCVESGVSDSNLVLTCLKNVLEAYEKIAEADRPEGLNWDGSQGSYVLSMDDARLIVRDIARRETKSGWQKRERVLESFKCPGCRTYQRAMSFEDCLRHVYSKHSETVGDEGDFWRLYRPTVEYREFPYYSTPWLRCMPVLPAYCDARAIRPWHPDSEMDFIREEEAVNKSAFEGRSALWSGDEPPTFVESFEQAIQTMHEVTLKPQYVVKVAFQYALDVSKESGSEVPSLDEFMEEVPSLQNKYPSLLWRFKCEICLRNLEDGPRARPVKFEVPISRLYKHWTEEHADDHELDWTLDFMRLPSNEELYAEIRENDQKLEKEKVKITGFDPEDNFKKRQNPKAAVILGTRFAMDAFNDLFPTADSEASPRRSSRSSVAVDETDAMV